MSLLLPGRLMRGIGGAAVVLLCAVCVAAGAAPWNAERLGRAVGSGTVDASEVRTSAWSEAVARAAARRILAEDPGHRYDDAERLLEHSARARPLYAPTWLLRAELARREGDPARAGRYAELVQRMWPRRERLLWNVAMLLIRMGDRNGGLRALGACLRANPIHTARIAWFAEKLEPDPAHLVAALVPVGELDPDRDVQLSALLRYAAGSHRTELADSVWSALSARARAQRDMARLYIDALIEAGSAREAAAIWRAHASAEAARSGFANPGFEELPTQGGLGWRIRSTGGSTWALDPWVHYEGFRSLRISFEGRENASYQSALQVLAVEPGASYRVTGWWRGANVSSRLGPYLEVVSRGPGPPLRVRTNARIGDWDWTEFQLDFKVPAPTSFVEFRVRRDRDVRRDVGIAGDVWLDTLRIERTEERVSDG